MTNLKRIVLVSDRLYLPYFWSILRCCLLFSSLILAITSLSSADTIILKNGRQIESPKCWQDQELVKCKVHGQIVGYPKDKVSEVRIDRVPEKPANGFRFGVWQSGITVHEAIDVAEANNYPFVRSGVITSNNSFNPKSCRPYADSDTRFEYKEWLFNKLATLRFSFTPTTKKLHNLEVVFNGAGNKDSEFHQQIESMLREKYGKPFKVTDHLLFKDYDWQINADAIITMRPMNNSVLVTYRDVTLTDLAETERLNSVRQGFTKRDKDKF